MFDSDSIGYLLAGLSPDERVQRDAATRAALLRGDTAPQFGRPRWGLEDPLANGAQPPPMPAQPPMPASPPNPAATPPQRPASVLPLARGIQAPGGLPTASPVTNDPLAAQQAALERRQQEALAEQARMLQPPDYSKAQEAYQQRAEGGNRQLMLALAAQRAGEGFQPLQAQFLKQSAEAQAPQKMLGGTMTPTGFVEDPEYRQELALKRNDAELKQIGAALQANITAQDRSRLELRQEQLRREMQANQLGMHADIANQAHLDRMAALAAKTGGGEGKILPVKTIGDLTEGQNKLQTVQRLGADFKPEYTGMTGMAKKFAGDVIPGLDTAANEWWRNYSKEAELIERHGLFGAALTPGELQSWRQADIRPGMPADKIQANLERRAQVLAQHQNNAIRNYGASGYNVSGFQPVDVPGASTPPAAGGVTAAKPAAGGGGQIAVNPQTGQRLRLVGGQWVPA